MGYAETILSDAGLEFLSTSYAGAPREPSLRDEPFGHVRNIRVKNPNQFYASERIVSVARPCRVLGLCIKILEL